MNVARNIARTSGALRSLENTTPQPNLNKRNQRKLIAAQHRQERAERRPRIISSLRPRLEKMTRDELRKLAAEQKIVGRGKMSKAELVEALS